MDLRFSIITPEHSANNLPYLRDLWDSIQRQTYTNWEWVLFLNNGCTTDHIPESIKNDPRVVVFWSFREDPNIGSIKHDAFLIGQGDVLVEADHDDILLPECLERLNQAFQDPGVGFAYSDNAVLHMKGEFTPYDGSFGWSWREFEYRGNRLKSMRSFPPTSQSLSYIWYAPDHVRAWRRQVYHDIGGHNPQLSVCDDHELMIRTYLATRMVHIPEVLYIYRITGDNTWLERNQAIQDRTRELFYQYGRQLAEHDARQRGLMCVDIGGGLNPYPGYVSVDLRHTADVQADLNEGIPLPDNSVGVLNASHILEHLHDKTRIMSEIHRVLAHGGWAFIEVPSTDGRGAFQDPTHVSYWNENSFLYYIDAYLANFIDNTTIRFQEFRRETWFPNDWLKNLNVLVTTAWLVAVKDGARLPGPLKI